MILIQPLSLSNEMRSVAQQLCAYLINQSKQLQDRISETDAEIGDKLALVQTDSLG